jgi:hypothetical protein
MRAAAACVVAATVLVISGCNQKASEQQPSNSARPVDATIPREAAPPPPPATGPDAKTPLGEPKEEIDPKSVEAAGQLVRHFGALIEQNRLGEAAKLWSNADSASAFTRQLHPSTHIKIGEPRGTEGAAGSIYTTIPVVFYDDTLHRPAEIILRRINDVPGSTEAQRRWHIERVDWKAPA